MISGPCELSTVDGNGAITRVFPQTEQIVGPRTPAKRGNSMSIDTFMMMRTTVPVKAIAERLIEDYGLVDDGDGCLGGNPTTVIVESWNREDHGNLIEGGFEAATIFIKFIPESSAAGFARQDHILASILRNTPGDACTQIQTGIVLGLLRVGSVVYVNPDSIGPEDLTENGYVPEKLVIGIPPDLEQVQRSPIR